MRNYIRLHCILLPKLDTLTNQAYMRHPTRKDIMGHLIRKLGGMQHRHDAGEQRRTCGQQRHCCEVRCRCSK